MTGAIFIREAEDRYRPTEVARGPWDPGALHGGAPAALIAGAIERADARAPMAVARITYELLRPVPLAPLTLSLHVERPGRRVQLLSASLHAGEHEVCRARALRIRRAELEGVPAPEPAPLPPRMPEDCEPGDEPPSGGYAMFANAAMEVRFSRGAFLETGPAFAWFRLRVPVVEGEETTPLQRLAAAGDFGNGISAAVGWDRFLFLNPDLTLYVEREPEGEWIGLDAETRLGADGAGISDSVLHDTRGRVGRALQSLFLDARATSGGRP